MKYDIFLRATVNIKNVYVFVCVWEDVSLKGQALVENHREWPEENIKKINFQYVCSECLNGICMCKAQHLSNKCLFHSIDFNEFYNKNVCNENQREKNGIVVHTMPKYPCLMWSKQMFLEFRMLCQRDFFIHCDLSRIWENLYHVRSIRKGAGMECVCVLWKLVCTNYWKFETIYDIQGIYAMILFSGFSSSNSFDWENWEIILI